MRFLLKAELPIEIGNVVIQNGRLAKTFRSILDDLKPEAVYFLASSGKRSVYLIVNMEDASQIPALAEPWFHAFQASVELVPVMIPDDLKKAEQGIKETVKKYGQLFPKSNSHTPDVHEKDIKTQPHIQNTEFGLITVEEEVFNHDIVIRLSGKVKKRKKKFSKEQYGTSHIISLEEAEYIFDEGAERLIIGSGQQDSMRLSAEAERYFKEKGCTVELHITPEAIQVWNEAEGKIISMFHVTC